METRKIQQVGGGTYTVSIPVHWAEDHGIRAGATAYLFTHRDGSLVVRWNEKERSELSSTVIELDDDDPDTAERMVRSAYSAGFTQIQVRNPTGFAPRQRRAIEGCTRNLAGVEITDESDRRVTVRGLLDPSDVSIRQSTDQLKYTSLAMYAAAVDLLTDGTSEAEHISHRTDEIHRHRLLIKRHFNRSLLNMTELDELGVTRAQLYEFDAVAGQLAHVGARADTIGRTVARTEYPVSEAISEELAATGEDAGQVVETAASAMLDDGSRERALSALDSHERVVRTASRVPTAAMEQSPDAVHAVTRVVDSMLQTARHGSNIAEVALQRTLRPE
ncbi:MAG: AbrB/MazE/SpoVT family DNA-binding domain-containing protein [Halobacteriota archaeon]